MARPRSAPASSPGATNQKPPPNFDAFVAASTAGELLPPEALAAAVPVAGALTVAAGAKVVAAILTGFDAFNRRRRGQLRAYLIETIPQLHPDRTDGEILPFVRDELARDREFVRNQRERLERDLALAMKLDTREKRRLRVEAILERERRYTKMREQAALQRAAARASHLTVRDESPEGAYWMLGLAATHTPDCVAMSGKFWPWEVLDKIHPLLHHGCQCQLLTKADAVQRGLMHPDQVPDVQDAIRRAAEIARTYSIVQEVATPQEISAYVEAILQESPIPAMHARLRYPKGTHEGGEFKPRYGVGHPVLARRAVERALRKLIPAAPSTPAQRRRDGAGEWREIAGQQVFVPEHRAFEREIGSRTWYSPPGSTAVYEQKQFVKRRPEMPRERGADLSDTAWKQRQEWKDQARAVAARALARQTEDTLPAEVGAHPKATHSGMLAAGFRMRREGGGLAQDLDDDTGEVTNHYLHVASGARARVSYLHGEVTHIGWTPGQSQKPTPLLDRAPRSEQEFLDDVFSTAHDLAERNGHTADLARVTINPTLADTAGLHTWEGVIELGRDARAAISNLVAARAAGRELDFHEAREAYKAYRTAVHEAHHAAVPIQPRVYERDETARGIEEALAEELAALDVVDVLRRQGHDDVLRWLKANPTDDMVEGSYTFYRRSLAQILDRAKIPPEKRASVLHILKYGFEPEQRASGLAALVTRGGSAHEQSHEQALDWIERLYARADRREAGGESIMFTPNVRPDLSDVPDTPSVEVLGQPVVPGVWVDARGHTGRVLRVRQTDKGPVLHVRYGGVQSDTEPEVRIHADEVTRVNTKLPGASEVKIGHTTYRPGDEVSYLNDTGKRTVATVERVIRLQNFDMKNWERGWQMEARTSEDEPVLLDEPRARGLRKEHRFLRRNPGEFQDPNTVPVQTALGPVTFRSSGDAVGPEYHATYIAVLADGTAVGRVNVAYYEGNAYIQHIEVPVEHRRKGIASALVQRIRNEQPDGEIRTLGDVATPEGQAFIASGRRSRYTLAEADSRTQFPEPIVRTTMHFGKHTVTCAFCDKTATKLVVNQSGVVAVCGDHVEQAKDSDLSEVRDLDPKARKLFAGTTPHRASGGSKRRVNVTEAEADEIRELIDSLNVPCDCGADNLPHEYGSACPEDGPVAIHEALYEEHLHPRDRRGEWTRKLPHVVFPGGIATGGYRLHTDPERATHALTQLVLHSKGSRSRDAEIVDRLVAAVREAGWKPDVVVSPPADPGKPDRLVAVREGVASALGARAAQPLREAHDVSGYREMTVEQRRAATAALPGGRFEVTDPAAVKDRAVLLVDDVVTSGEQAKQVRDALHAAGASSVRLVALAHAPSAPEDHGDGSRWRSKLGAGRLVLKAEKKLTKPQVRSRAQQVADALVDFYGGDKVTVHHEPEYLATVGSDARFRHEGEVLPGLLYGARIHDSLTDPEYGVEMFRVIAHEAAHSLSGNRPGALPGFAQHVEEGGAEILSLWFWRHRGQEFDHRDAVRVDGKWTEGLDSLAHHVAYREWTAETLKRAASKVGWDRAAIIDEVERVMRGGHYDRLRFRDETTEDVKPPDGVADGPVSLIRWLLDAGGPVQEAAYDPKKHPRGRGGRWIDKGVTHLRVKLPGKSSFLLRITHETESMVHGVEVDHSDNEVVPKGRTKEGERYTDRMHVIEKSAASRMEPRVMSRKYAELVPPEEAADADVQAGDAGSPIDVGDDVNRAAELLAEGKHVVLSQPRQVSTLLDKLAEIVREARDKGQEAPHFDLCKVSVKGTNLFCAESKGIPRVQMPQFKGMPVPGSKADALPKNDKGRVALDDAWREHLRGLGVEVEQTTEKASYLRASQRDLNGANVARIAHEIEAGRKTQPIFVSRDNYILDGHHQWAATVGAGSRDNVLDEDMPVERIDMPITDLIAEAQRFTREWGMAAQSGSGGNETVDPLAWSPPPPPVGSGGRGHGYSSDEAYGTNTALGHVAESAFVKILGGGRILHPEGKGAQSPLDVRFDGYGFEVKGVSTKTLGYKATPKKHEIASKEEAAKELGVKAALAIVVIDSDAGMAHAYYRDGLKGGRLSQNTGWKYIGSTPLDDPAQAEAAHRDPRIRESGSVLGD